MWGGCRRSPDRLDNEVLHLVLLRQKHTTKHAIFHVRNSKRQQQQQGAVLHPNCDVLYAITWYLFSVVTTLRSDRDTNKTQPLFHPLLRRILCDTHVLCSKKV